MSTEGGEEKKLVPLEEVRGTIYTQDESGELKPQEFGWQDLNDKEKAVIKLIAEGKYGEASDRVGQGHNVDYSKEKVRNFLVAASDKSDPGLSTVFSNNYVGEVLDNR